MQEALANGSAAAKQSEFVVYPDAPHAFHADYRPSYRKDAAEDGWKRCLAWFKAQRRRLTRPAHRVSPRTATFRAPERCGAVASRDADDLATSSRPRWLGGLLSVVVAASLTVGVLRRVVHNLVSLSAGVLLGTALLHVLPEAFESGADAQACS